MENIGVGKSLCMPLKLSEVFGAEKNTQAKDSNHSLEKTNKKDCKEKSRSILNKYRITEINKGGIVDIKVRSKSCSENGIGRGSNEALEKDGSTNVKSKSGKEADLEESSRVEPEESSKVRPEESSKVRPEESSKEASQEVAAYSSNHLDEPADCRKGVGAEGERAVIKNVVRRKAYKQSNMLIANGTAGLIVHNGIMCLAKKGNEVFILTSIKKSFCVYDQHKLKRAYCSNYFSEDIKELHAANNYVYVLFKKKVYKVNDKEGKKIFASNCHKYDIINMLTVSDYLLTYSKKEIVIWHDERGEIKEEEGDKVRDPFLINSDRDTSSEGSDESEGELHRTGEHIKRKRLTNKCSSVVCEGKVSGVQGHKRETTSGEQASGNPESGEECREVKNESTNYVYKVIELFDENSHFEIKQIFHPDGYTNKVIILTNEDKLYLYNINKEKIIHEYNSVENLGLMTHNTSDFKDVKFDSRGKRIKLMSLTEQNREICIVTFTNEIHIMDIEKDEIIYSRNIHMNDDFISCVNFYSYKKDGENICIILKIISNAYLKLPNSVIFKEEIFIVESSNGKKKKGKYSSINGYVENCVKLPIKVKTGEDDTFYGKTKTTDIYAKDYNICEKDDDSCDSDTNFENSHSKREERAKREKHATSVLISTCGHIGIVGYKGGEIHSFNIQSRQYRSEYKINKYSIKSKAHTHGDILKLYLYGVNHFVSAANSHEDLYLRVWNLYTSELVYAYNVGEALGGGIQRGSSQGGSSQVGYPQGGNPHGGDRNRGVSIVSFYQCNILTVVCLSNDYTLVLDIEQKCVVRKFHFACSVTYVTFSKDNRIILFALKNRTLLLYEIISNTFVDYILFQNEILSMIYNDINLYTAHGKSPHFLYSFTNKNLFNNNNYVVSDYKLFNAIPIDEFADSDNEHCCETYNLKQLTNANDEMGKEEYTTFFAEEEGNKGDALLNQDKNNYIHVMQSYKSSEKQISRNLLTLSGFNISKIAYLIFLDKIKENCRVEENVKKNQDIPFFLSAKLDTNIQYVDTKEKEFLQNITKNDTDTAGGLENQKEEEEKEAGETAEEVTKDAAGEEGVKQEDNQVKSRIIQKNRRKKQNLKIEMPGSKLQQILGKSEPTYIDALKYLKSLSPSGVHFNILCLSTKEELENMMNFFIYHVKTNDNIDLIQAYILIFLKAHGKKLMRTKEKNLRNSTKVLLQEIQGSWSSINLLFENIIFFIKFLTNIQLE
ncbi:U3 small nucleolar RNA-associated protein 21, putative (UTP21) [Plasmodium ovale wallikeri]|uniref:U3 small nucleolar RNA-associated protein 21, putative (UTP21) n=1 Tax=Plasmodium ovale wallikeri TaxID=864142 RepID=A0A1A8Z0I9_PLAOA|nr:U3 small nucleolar RNA-associated protein 21, putative (UTP21) [Plasmodium ovale wallikeri]SBT37956.1 U3 small nucleolar RNA-associated protein 21, putative (UTP21) [Plasmodium ovale wallikeri]